MNTFWCSESPCSSTDRAAGYEPAKCRGSNPRGGARKGVYMEDKDFEKKISDTRKIFAEWKTAVDEDIQKKWDETDYDTKLLLTAYVFSKIREHIHNPGSYRYLIYDRLGFKTDAYSVLFVNGGMDISNGCHTIADYYIRLSE
jgi:hypothetical protein